MLIVTDYNMINQIYETLGNISVFNIASVSEAFPRLNIIPPVNNIINEKDFDIYYYNYIMNNDEIFKQVFHIVKSLYYGGTVVLLASPDVELIMESLTKFIQSRYGYNATYIYAPEDLANSVYNKDPSEFSIMGLDILESDDQRYQYLIGYDDNGQPII